MIRESVKCVNEMLMNLRSESVEKSKRTNPHIRHDPAERERGGT